MTDTEILNHLESLLECGSARIEYNEDDGIEDDWGKIPIGYSIRVRACNEFNVSASNLRGCVLKAWQENQKWVNDEIDDE